MTEIAKLKSNIYNLPTAKQFFRDRDYLRMKNAAADKERLRGEELFSRVAFARLANKVSTLGASDVMEHEGIAVNISGHFNSQNGILACLVDKNFKNFYENATPKDKIYFLNQMLTHVKNFNFNADLRGTIAEIMIDNGPLAWIIEQFNILSSPPVDPLLDELKNKFEQNIKANYTDFGHIKNGIRSFNTFDGSVYDGKYTNKLKTVIKKSPLDIVQKCLLIPNRDVISTITSNRYFNPTLLQRETVEWDSRQGREEYAVLLPQIKTLDDFSKLGEVNGFTNLFTENLGGEKQQAGRIDLEFMCKQAKKVLVPFSEEENYMFPHLDEADFIDYATSLATLQGLRNSPINLPYNILRDKLMEIANQAIFPGEGRPLGQDNFNTLIDRFNRDGNFTISLPDPLLTDLKRDMYTLLTNGGNIRNNIEDFLSKIGNEPGVPADPITDPLNAVLKNFREQREAVISKFSKEVNKNLNDTSIPEFEDIRKFIDKRTEDAILLDEGLKIAATRFPDIDEVQFLRQDIKDKVTGLDSISRVRRKSLSHFAPSLKNAVPEIIELTTTSPNIDLDMNQLNNLILRSFIQPTDQSVDGKLETERKQELAEALTAYEETFYDRLKNRADFNNAKQTAQRAFDVVHDIRPKCQNIFQLKALPRNLVEAVLTAENEYEKKLQELKEYRHVYEALLTTYSMRKMVEDGGKPSSPDENKLMSKNDFEILEKKVEEIKNNLDRLQRELDGKYETLVEKNEQLEKKGKSITNYDDDSQILALDLALRVNTKFLNLKEEQKTLEVRDRYTKSLQGLYECSQGHTYTELTPEEKNEIIVATQANIREYKKINEERITNNVQRNCDTVLLRRAIVEQAQFRKKARDTRNKDTAIEYLHSLETRKDLKSYTEDQALIFGDTISFEFLDSTKMKGLLGIPGAEYGNCKIMSAVIRRDNKFVQFLIPVKPDINFSASTLYSMASLEGGYTALMKIYNKNKPAGALQDIKPRLYEVQKDTRLTPPLRDKEIKGDELQEYIRESRKTAAMRDKERKNRQAREILDAGAAAGKKASQIINEIKINYSLPILSGGVGA